MKLLEKDTSELAIDFIEKFEVNQLLKASLLDGITKKNLDCDD